MLKKLLHLLSLLSPLYKYEISGDSMKPVLSAGDSVLVNRLVYIFRPPKVGEIVVLKDPRDKKVIVKRITHLAGQKFFVQGDNKMHSTDSREFGMIERSAIIGKVLIQS